MATLYYCYSARS